MVLTTCEMWEFHSLPLFCLLSQLIENVTKRVNYHILIHVLHNIQLLWKQGRTLQVETTVVNTHQILKHVWLNCTWLMDNNISYYDLIWGERTRGSLVTFWAKYTYSSFLFISKLCFCRHRCCKDSSTISFFHSQKWQQQFIKSFRISWKWSPVNLFSQLTTCPVVELFFFFLIV